MYICPLPEEKPVLARTMLSEPELLPLLITDLLLASSVSSELFTVTEESHSKHSRIYKIHCKSRGDLESMDYQWGSWTVAGPRSKGGHLRQNKNHIKVGEDSKGQPHMSTARGQWYRTAGEEATGVPRRLRKGQTKRSGVTFARGKSTYWAQKQRIRMKASSNLPHECQTKEKEKKREREKAHSGMPLGLSTSTKRSAWALAARNNCLVERTMKRYMVHKSTVESTNM